MSSDFIGRSLLPGAYSVRPFTILDSAAHEDLSNITAIDLVENGDRTAREMWQNKQLTNLLRHAQGRSKYWRERMPSRMINHAAIKYIPIQSRKDVTTQVEQEGPLTWPDVKIPILNYASTGSTGTPVKIFYFPQNAYYNSVRGLAEYFIKNLSLEENRVNIRPPTSVEKLLRGKTLVKLADTWAGPLGAIFHTGSSKEITHADDDDALIAELSKSRVGYLNCQSRFIEIILKKGGVELLKELDVKLWIHVSDYRDVDVVQTLAAVGIPSFSNYSAGECGPIAYECRKHQGYFHVAHSNAIVECDDTVTTSFNGISLGRLLITHLHSYATPIIRYDIGDFAQLHQQCLCGHDGPTISNIFGRGKHFLRHPSGRLVPFYLSTRALVGAVRAEEFRVRQTKVDTITVEIGGRETITVDEEVNLKKIIVAATDTAFIVEVKTVKKIDWSDSAKHLFFSSSVT